MIKKKGRCVCVVHGHARKKGSKTDKAKGSNIKCYCGASMKENWRKAGAMHAAIRHSQTGR